MRWSNPGEDEQDEKEQRIASRSLVKCANKSHNCFPLTLLSFHCRMKLKVICGQSQNKETFISNFLDVFNYLRPLEHRICSVRVPAAHIRNTHIHIYIYIYVSNGALQVVPLYIQNISQQGSQTSQVRCASLLIINYNFLRGSETLSKILKDFFQNIF